ncbi:MAG: hypothetical protein AAF630_15915 [Cyanobacteria bacterium P01_C01_bin.38]
MALLVVSGDKFDSMDEGLFVELERIFALHRKRDGVMHTLHCNPVYCALKLE